MTSNKADAHDQLQCAISSPSRLKIGCQNLPVVDYN